MEVIKLRNYISNKILMRVIKFLLIILIFFFPYSISIREGLVALLFIFYVLNKLISLDFSLVKTPFDNEIFIYLVFSFLSLFKVNNLLYGIEEIIVSPFKYIALFYIAYDLIKKNKIKLYFNFLFYGSISLLVIGKLVFYFSGTNYIGGNGAGTWASFTLFMVIYMLIFKKTSKLKIVFSIFGSIIGLNVLFGTTSRGAVISFFSGLIITAFIFFNKKINNKKKLYALFFLILSIILIITPFFLPDRLMNKFKRMKNINANWSLKTRVIMWESSLHHIVRNPILGVGIGNYRSHYLDYIDNKLKTNVPTGSRMHDHPHNLFLYIAVEQGVISLVVFLIILFRSFKIAFYNFNIGDENSYFALVLIGILISLIIHSLVDTTFRYGHVAYFAMFFVIYNFKIANIKKEC